MPATECVETPVLDIAADGSLRREFVRAIATTAELYTRFVDCRAIDVPSAVGVVDRLRHHLRDSYEATIAMAVQPLYDGYPVRHSVQSSVLCMAMGIDVGFSDDDLQSIGLGSLIHDVGMLLVPSRVLGVEPITERDRQDLMRHPLHASAALDGQAGIAPDVPSVAAQIHERLDGSGYPCGLKGAAIHRLARYAAVADAFLGMISPRPHRPAQEPYCAIEEILFAGHRGRFDAGAVKTLLRVVSLYPIGSWVWLNDGRVGRVIRSNPETVDRPVIATTNLAHDSPGFQPVDLSKSVELSIVRVGEPAR